jgi:glycosyltransferase involved in cell wall biosynthesis
MRIGLNLLYLIPGVVGGTETYARGLISGLKQLELNHEYFIFMNRESAGVVQYDSPKFKSIICPVSASNRKSRYYFEQVKLRHYLNKYKIHLLHSLGYVSPLFLQCPTVVTVPDLNIKAFGKQMQVIRRLVLELFIRQSVIRSNKIITISEFSRNEILNEYCVPFDKIVVTHLAVDRDDFKINHKTESMNTLVQFRINQPYILAFSSAYYNKNISRLIEAFLEAKKNNKIKHKLILIGHSPHPIDNEKYAKLNLKNSDIIWTGYLNKQQVIDILKHADFLIFPSFYEGFGLPILEAMAVGIPVVCSKAASLPEVAGDAAVFFDPFSVKDIAVSIESVAINSPLRAKLKQKGFENLKRFSWKKSAAETVSVYEELLQGSK